MSVFVVVVVLLVLQQASGGITPDCPGPSTVEKCVCSPAIYVDYGDRKSGETDASASYRELQAQVTQLQGTVESLLSEKDMLIADVRNLASELALRKKLDHEKYVCSDGYVQFLDRCFRFSADRKTYAEARAICQADGGNLAMPKDQITNDFLVDQLKTKYSNPYLVWFGLTDQVQEGTWVWEDGTPLTGWNSYWAQYQPDDDYHAGQDCAYWGSKYGYRWDDGPCTFPRHYVCEIQATAL